jgi:hypothetical protein
MNTADRAASTAVARAASEKASATHEHAVTALPHRGEHTEPWWRAHPGAPAIRPPVARQASSFEARSGLRAGGLDDRVGAWEDQGLMAVGVPHKVRRLPISPAYLDDLCDVFVHAHGPAVNVQPVTNSRAHRTSLSIEV